MITGRKRSYIEGFENYQITEKGEIYLLNYYYPDQDCYGVLSSRIDRAGYYTVRLYKNKRWYTHYLHRLLSIEFVPNPENKKCINHKDGNKLNNCLDNLEWVTHSENIKHAFSLGLIKRKGRAVVDTQTGKLYKNAKEAAIMNGLPYATCKNYLNGNRPNPTGLQYVAKHSCK
jgi:hypothetical protein